MKLDVIGIGALNYDYICHYVAGLNEGQIGLQETGIEDLNLDETELTLKIKDFLAHDKKYKVRFGGSAYLTIKTVSFLGLDLKTGFVGVTGTPNDIEEIVGIKPNSIKSEFEHLSSKEWLFIDPGTPGRALVLLRDGKRQSISVAPGANDFLWDNIIKKEQETGIKLEEYLASAKWVHITSLRNLKQFENIIERIQLAKDINTYLKVSIDPGYEYTKKNTKWLSRILPIADFIFLNENELNNLKGGPQFPLKTRLHRLRSLVSKNTQIFVIKGRASNALIQFWDQEPLIRPYRYEKLPCWEIKDDTGAGDVFAGGVIGGLLTPRMLAHQPAPMELGLEVAKQKLRSNGFPSESFAQIVKHYLHQKMELEDQSWSQRFKFLLKSTWAIIIGFVVSFFAGIASGFILHIWFS